jgi:polysaccharide pyruvyl transferase WcaK-like protein
VNGSLIGFYGKRNFGDDQMEIAIKQFFRKLCINLITSQTANEQLVVIGGGGIITNKFPIFQDISKLKDKKVIIFNVNLTTEADLIIDKLKDIDIFWVVRDYWSINYLKNKDIANVMFAPDICLYSFPQKKVEKRKIVSVVCNYYIFKNIFSENVRERIFAERAYEELSRFLKWLTTFGWSIQLIPAQTSSIIDDRITNAYLQGLLGGKAKIIYDNNYIINDLRKSELVISTRFHFTIYALANQLPFIDLTFHSKNSNLHHDIGLTHHALNYYDFLQEDCIKNINEIENNPSHQEKIDNYRVKGQHSWKTIETEIYKYIT